MSKRRPASGLDGILLVDKEAGWTSHDVVAKCRGITGQPRIGHTGTLDPSATGLLVLCLGRVTRLVENMAGHAKEYEGEIALGVATDTDDAEGVVIAKAPVPPLDLSVLRSLEQQFTGELEQVPPAYSAVKVEGRRAYAVARKGGEVKLAPRKVIVHSLTLEQLMPDRLAIRVNCGPGTYVRSIARDIGAALGCGAHLASLRRTRNGVFDLAEALRIDHVQATADAGALADVVRAPDEGVMDLDAAVVANERGDFLANGRTLQVRTQPWRPSEHTRIYRFDGSFVGIGKVDEDGVVRPTKILTGATA